MSKIVYKISKQIVVLKRRYSEMAFSRAVNFLSILSSNALQRSLSISARKAAILPVTKLLRTTVCHSPRYFPTIRPFCDKSSDNKPLNIDEEMLRYDYEEYEENVDTLGETEVVELPSHLSERGEQGVYDLDQLVQLLKDEKMIDLCAISIPEEVNYCDQMIISTGKTFRHLRAVAEKIKFYYKAKRHNTDPSSVDIEGLTSKNWLAMDLGNIVVHLFLEEERIKYNLEELWTVGPKYDDHCRDFQEKDISDFSLSGSSFEEELEKFRNTRTTN